MIFGLAGPGIESINTRTKRAKPQRAVGTWQQGTDVVVGQTLVVRRIVPVGGKCLVVAIVRGQAAAVGRNPKLAVFGFSQVIDVVAAKSLAVAAPSLEDFELVAVVLVQTVLGTEPYKALRVLEDREDVVLRQPVILRELIEAHRRIRVAR